MSSILIIDLGTTFFKFTRFDRDGQLLNTARILAPIRQPLPEYQELDPAEFLQVIQQGIGQLSRQAGELCDLEFVSFATQTNSFVLLGPGDAPLTPIILWPDRRAMCEGARVLPLASLPDFKTRTGVPALNEHFMLTKLLWVQQQCPRTWEQMRRVCLLSDYLTLQLTGQHVSEAGTAGLTALLDIEPCRWWSQALSSVQLEEQALPEIVRAGTSLGRIQSRAADLLGLPGGCQFVVGCLDQYAGAIGVGNTSAGDVSETTGTVLAAVRCASELTRDADSRVFQGPGFTPGVFYQMCFGDTSARYLQWLRDQLPDRPDFESLLALAHEIAPGADGLRLKPEEGLSVPEKVFAGLTAQHGRGHQVRCILEAVAWALHDHVRALTGGVRPAEIRAAGGGARSSLWLQIKADVLGVPFWSTACPEPTSLGAAILTEAARSGAGVPDVARRWVKLADCQTPDPRMHQVYHHRGPSPASRTASVAP